MKYLSNWISHQQFQGVDKKLLTELFIKNDAKFHKSCTNQFSDMKIEKAEKKLRANEDQITKDVIGTEQSCSSTIQGNSKRTYSRSRQLMTLLPNVFSVIVLMVTFTTF